MIARKTSRRSGCPLFPCSTSQTPGPAYRITTFDIGGVPVTLDDNYGHKVNVAPSDTTADLTPQSVKPDTGNPTNDNQLQTTFTYQAYAPTAITRPNNDISSYTYDGIGRVATATSRYGAVTTYTYYPAQNQTVTTTPVDGTTRWQRTTTDGFGRTLKVESGNGTNPGTGTMSTVETRYGPCACSPLGKVVAVSLPFAPGETEVWTNYTYDATGRTLTVQQPDGSTTSYAYTGQTTKVIDPANNWKQFTTDAFGNLTTVAEPDPNNGSNILYTNYTYDVFNHLTGVSMPRSSGTQTRTFSYDANTARLNSVITPEAGAESYTYNYDGTVNTKTDAKGQATQYHYDGYQRVIEVDRFPSGLGGSADACQTVNYTYDADQLQESGTQANGVGRVTEQVWKSPDCNYTFTEDYAYNYPGQVVVKRLKVKNASSQTVTMRSAFSYDGEGRVLTIQPPGVDYNNSAIAIYHYDRDALGRAVDSYTMAPPPGYGQTYIVAPGTVSYNGAGQMTSMGSETRQYNLNHQLTRITATQSGATVMDLQYNFPTGAGGNNLGPANNGRVANVVDNVSGDQVSYVYDQLNRLTQATAGAWGLSFSYDGFGNLLQQTATKGAPPQMSLQINPANNQITNNANYAYDANGNMTLTPSGSYTFDVANRMVQDGNGTVYCYSPQGQRVMEESVALTIFAYGPRGELLGKYTPNWTVGTASLASSAPRYYFNGILVQETGNGNPVFTDRLGSVRYSGQAMNYYPYGNEITSTADGRGKFATYWRDSAGLDYANQRYYANAIGRFLTPDPGGMGTVKLQDPTSWNRYAYVNADPINFMDPSGLYPCGATWADDGSGRISVTTYDCISSGGGQGPTGGGSGGDPCYAQKVPMPGCVDAGGAGGYNGTATGPGSLPAEGCTINEIIMRTCPKAGAATAAGLLSRAGMAATAAWWITANIVGRAGETIVGNILNLTKNTSNLITNTLSGTDRIPDFWSDAQELIVEVKNVSYLSYTDQLRDMAQWAQTKGWTFQLWVNSNATLSDELKQAVKNGWITLEKFSWP